MKKEEKMQKIPNDNLKDQFSRKFEDITPIKKREKHGQFFTHKEIVEYILDSLPIKEDSRVIDPACGAGAFLSEVLKRNGNRIENVYGIDIDAAALKLCESSIFHQSDKHSKNLKKADTLQKDKLFDIQFDFVVGNPPFKNLKSNGQEFPLDYPIYNEVSLGIVNAATLMVARSYEMLKEGGWLGFVLPKNIVRVDSFKKFRMFLIKNTRLKKILDLNHHFKDVRGDQLILIFQKEKLSEDELKNNIVEIIPYRKNKSLKEQKGYFIKQSDLLDYDIFPLFYSLEVKSLADKLLKIPYRLSNYSDIFRGLSLGSKDSLIQKENFEGSIVCYRGDSIKKFGIKYPLYIDLKRMKISDKRKAKRILKNKAILQNLFSKEGGIFASLSSNKEINLDTVTNVVPKDNVDPEIILGILSSRLANFFMIHVTFLNSNFTMHADKAYLGKIPTILPENPQKEKIKKIIQQLNKIDDKYSQEFINKYNTLNTEIYKLYRLDENEIKILEDSLKEVMSKKQNG